jgi:hypothetical protein
MKLSSSDDMERVVSVDLCVVATAEVENPAQNMLNGAARAAAARIAIVDFIFVASKLMVE